MQVWLQLQHHENIRIEMISRTYRITLLFLTVGLLSAQTFQVGTLVSGDFTAPVCGNGNGLFRLSDYDGERNGGDYNVIWINFFASW
jgi:hypothetical protein